VKQALKSVGMFIGGLLFVSTVGFINLRYDDEAYVESPTYFASCSEAKDAGYVNVKSDDSLYRADLDGDSDGLACEPYTGPQ
jgi:hypothetical protein